ncbi:hypothetical protein [Massilia sp. PWRC2]
MHPMTILPTRRASPWRAPALLVVAGVAGVAATVMLWRRWPARAR